ncbi:hypothetical protein GCM10010232_45720 [Streptomyces amakusaensis]|uniref:DUF6332 family protein n=1 Tax=Streptomyces amakusaensis TaxID=67271 RepID=A0ABW0AIR0_9ACTN
MTQRTQADRDAITVEIGYALLSGVFVAAVVFGAIAGPGLAFTLPPAVEHALLLAGGAAGAIVFTVRVVTVLWRFARPRDETAGAGGPGRNQPSQPGRTSPDS